MRSMLAASKRWKWIALAAAIGAVGVGFAAPASADDDRYGEHRNWRSHGYHDRHDHGWRRHHYHRHYVRPPVVYYQAPPRYVVPPPVYYRPHYEPGVSLNFNLR